MGRLYGSFFLHANMHYAEIPAAKLPDLVARSYVPAFQELASRPGAKAAVEFSGFSLEWLAEHAPSVIDTVRALVRRGDAELLASTYANPILPLLPPEDGARQIDRFMAIWERLFGDLGARPRGFYSQEYALDASVTDLLARYGFEWVVLSSGHYRISQRGLLNSAVQRIPPQEEFWVGDPVCRPYDVIGARGSRLAAFTWNMPGPNDLVFGFKDGRMNWEQMADFFEGLEAMHCHREDGFFLLAPADTEFIGTLPPQGSLPGPVWGRILDGFLTSGPVTLTLPSAYLDAHPVREALYLKAGAGARFSDLQNWTADPDNVRLNALCDDARSQIRLAESMIDLLDALGFPTEGARAHLAEAREALLLADNSDGRGWKPLPERRLACYDQALAARDAAAAALKEATEAVRRARHADRN